jgi:cell division protein FtsB
MVQLVIAVLTFSLIYLGYTEWKLRKGLYVKEEDLTKAEVRLEEKKLKDKINKLEEEING